MGISDCMEVEMKAVVFAQTGSWLDTLALAEWGIGDPAPHEAQVRVLARPINPSDKMFIQGVYRQRPQLPQIAGLEGAGIVEKVGQGMDAGLVGKHVAFRAQGTWAERVNVPVQALRVIPDAIPMEVGCQLSLNGMSAYALLERAGLARGQWLALSAANSSLGKLIVQLAKLRGIRVLALVRKPGNQPAMLRLGADTVLLDDSPQLEQAIIDATGGGAHAILDAVGGKLGSTLIKAAAPAGKLILYGRLSPDGTELAYGDVIYKNLVIEGFGIDHWMASKSARELDAIWQALAESIAAGRLALFYDRTFALADFKAAIACSENAGGKVILA